MKTSEQVSLLIEAFVLAGYSVSDGWRELPQRVAQLETIATLGYEIVEWHDHFRDKPITIGTYRACPLIIRDLRTVLLVHLADTLASNMDFGVQAVTLP